MKKIDAPLPTYDELINPVFKAMKQLGGSGSNDEIYEKVIDLMGLSDDVLEIMHLGNENLSEISYRLAWARTYLKKYGVINNTSRGIWMINGGFDDIDELDYKDVVRNARSLAPRTKDESKKEIDEAMGILEENRYWKEYLRKILLRMDPAAFERLAQLLLRESGVTQVEVTGRVGDGGIDGVGQLRLNGIISFKIAFQCKRYSGSVPSKDIRDFRGSMTTDVEKGLFITTGTFTRDAVLESSMAGKKTIDLIDGDNLMDKLAELELGLKPVKTFEVDEEFYNRI